MASRIVGLALSISDIVGGGGPCDVVTVLGIF